MIVYTFAWDDDNGTGCSVHMTERERDIAFINHIAEAAGDGDEEEIRVEAMRILDDPDGDLWGYLEGHFAMLATFGLDQETLPDPGVYLKLFHGRKTLDENLDDWGEAGPVFGPFPYFHTTYATDIKFGDGYALSIIEDMVYYDGMFYGDWTVIDGSTLKPEEEIMAIFSDEASRLPKTIERGEAKPPKVIVVLEGGLVTGILSNLPVEAAVIDYDTDTYDEPDTLTQIPQAEGEPEVEAYAFYYSSVEVKPERTEQLWAAITKEKEDHLSHRGRNGFCAKCGGDCEYDSDGKRKEVPCQ